MNLADIKKELSDLVGDAYANNSRLYSYLEKQASLQDIVTFLYWDSLQPTFKSYIERWLKKTPDFLVDELKHHIAEEEGHSELFNQMMANLMREVDIDVAVVEARLKTLNYTFSPECVVEQEFGFFCGGSEFTIGFEMFVEGATDVDDEEVEVTGKKFEISSL